jgi:hypothetical protein
MLSVATPSKILNHVILILKSFLPTALDKNIDPKHLFGIWKDNPRTIEQIRSNGGAKV